MRAGLLLVAVMLGGKRIGVVVPAHNEAQLIEHTLGRIPPCVDQVVVVDDGSTDDTARIAEAVGDPRVRVLRLPQNQGVGRAIATGYAAAFALGVDVAVVMAGDGQMDPEDLPALLAPVLAGEADYAKGDRLSHPDARACMPRLRFVGNRVLSMWTRWATGLSVHDSQCGYTALSRRAYDRLCWDELWPRYGYPNDLIGALAREELDICDVVVRPVYGNEQSGIGVRHGLFVIPYVLGRVALRRFGATLPERAGATAAARAVRGARS